MEIKLRPFTRADIPDKIRWINDPRVNRYLHYELPLEREKTERWFDSVKDRTDRYDAVIEAEGRACGTIGLLSIDRKSGKAELYVALGEPELGGRGIASKACRLLLDYAFEVLDLNRVYLFTETENLPAQRLFERIGFRKEGCLRQEILSHGVLADRFVYGILREEHAKGAKHP